MERPKCESYAYHFEDQMILFCLNLMKIKNITYLDVGCNEPIILNNSYLFYKYGYRGVVIEPIPLLHDKISKERPEDVLIKGAITYNNETEGVIKRKKSDSSKSYLTDIKYKDYPECYTIKLYNINDIIEKYFNGQFPAFITIDTEGLDTFILKTLDFDKYPVPIICAETDKGSANGLVDFMRSKGYSVEFTTVSNTIFHLKP